MELKLKTSKLFNTFKTKLVEILCKLNVHTEEGQQIPFTVQGYLVDEDEEFYYIGQNSIEVDRALSKYDVVYIQEITSGSEYTELLSSVDENDGRH